MISVRSAERHELQRQIVAVLLSHQNRDPGHVAIDGDEGVPGERRLLSTVTATRTHFFGASTRTCVGSVLGRLRAFACAQSGAVLAPTVRDICDGDILDLEGVRGPSIAQQVPLDPIMQGQPQPLVAVEGARGLLGDGCGCDRQRHEFRSTVPRSALPPGF